jgi:hypothetical protein
MFTAVQGPTIDEPLNASANVELAVDGARSARSKGGPTVLTDGTGVNEIRCRRPHAPRSGSPSDAILCRRKIVDEQTWMLRIVTISASEFRTETTLPRLGPASARPMPRHLGRIRATDRPRILRSQIELGGSVRHLIWSRACTEHPTRRLTGSSIAFHCCRRLACFRVTKSILQPFKWRTDFSQTESILDPMPQPVDRVNLADLRALATAIHLPKQLIPSANASRDHQTSFSER